MDNLHNTTSSIRETLDRAIDLKKNHGITRLADITNFSKINLPVWIGTRPNAKCLSQSGGKGLTSEAAMLSALMEGIEVSYAENIKTDDAVIAKARIPEINGYECLNIYEHPIRPVIITGDDIRWIPIQNLDTKEKAYAPYEFLSLDFTRPKSGRPNPKKMITTSNGVASGGNITEATVSALLEIIERHSIIIKHRIKQDYSLLKLDRFKSEHVSKVIHTIEQGGGTIMLFDSTIIDGVYTVEAVQWSDDHSIPITHGMGASLSLETAILRAILEANQATTIILSGSRDDITKSTYTTMMDSDAVLKKFYSKINKTSEPDQNLSIHKKISPDEELKLIRKYLHEYNQQPVYRHVFSNQQDPISAVKVIVPKMEGYHINGYTPVSEEGKRIENQQLEQHNKVSGLDLAAGGGA